MKKTIFLIILLPILAMAFDIADFDVDITVNEDESLIIEEKIRVDFGNEKWHGIERFLPIKYRRGNFNYKVRFNLISVEDKSGRKVNVSQYKKGKNIVLRLGDKDRYVSGIKFYVIKYKVQRAINYFDENAELYWNVTGNEWKIPIRQASATIHFPNLVQKGMTEAKCFTGAYGKQETDCDIEYLEDGSIKISTGQIIPGEGLTFATQFPAHYLEQPSTSQKIIWFLSDNFSVMLGILLPILTLIYMTILWYKKGRDPITMDSAMVRYKPPEQLQPAQAGSLYDETVDMRDITSSIIDLAVRGYIRIEEIVTKQLLFFSNKDYRLVQLKDYSDLKNFEVTLMQALFSYGTSSPDSDYKHVMVSELKNKFYSDLKSIKTAIESSLVDEGCFDELPQETIKKYALIGIIGFILAGISVAALHSIAMGVGFLISSIIALIFSKFMPAKTRKGATLARHIFGFKEFIERVEKDRLERMATDDPTIFDRLLPYAMALGVEDKWANAFSDLYREPPNWYRGHGMGSTFTTAAFVSSLGHAMNQMGNTMSSTPRGSSAGSGGSGFSGGGFSGGGFGGGGGGGW